MDEDKFYTVLADRDNQQYLFEAEDSAEETQSRETVAAAGFIWPTEQCGGERMRVSVLSRRVSV